MTRLSIYIGMYYQDEKRMEKQRFILLHGDGLPPDCHLGCQAVVHISLYVSGNRVPLAVVRSSLTKPDPRSFFIFRVDVIYGLNNMIIMSKCTPHVHCIP